MDCNNFFVSCERLFRPDLLRKPVAVLSSNDGCIVARSQEVKDLGISMGVPYFEVQDICTKHRVTLFSSNFTLYRDISARVMTALKSEFSTYEVYSVDEAFFEIGEGVTESEIASIRARIMQKTGIPVSIGVATTKTLAKVANGIAKKGTGVCIMGAELWSTVQKELPCGSVWGIGRKTSSRLSQQKIYTVADLLRLDMTFVRQNLGVVGERLRLELTGTPVHNLGEQGLDDDEQQSYTSTRSFSNPVKDKLVLMSALGHHIAHVAEKLRNDGNVAGKMTVIARGSRFGDFALREGSASIEFSTPSNDTMLLTKEASKLLETLFDSEIPYKKAGVTLSGIMNEEYTMKSLFQDRAHQDAVVSLDRINDLLNKKFGAGTVRSGVTLNPDKWQERKKLKSQEYTTQWPEIATVKAK